MRKIIMLIVAPMATPLSAFAFAPQADNAHEGESNHPEPPEQPTETRVRLVARADPSNLKLRNTPDWLLSTCWN